LVQQACERLLRKPEAYDGILCLESWMYRVINNAWIDENRSMRAKLSEPLDEAIEVAGENGEHTVDVRSTLARVRREMAQLPVEQRSVLMLVCVDCLSYQEAATVLAILVGTLMSRLSRARLALAERLRQPQAVVDSDSVGKVG
jgi:RNA polymerase sigma-70 factor (ECF subfamily)